MYLLYNLALCLAAAVAVPWAAWRTLRGRLPGLGERFGRFDWNGFEAGCLVIWIHAVSVGEVKSAAALLEDLKSRIPNFRFVITTSTRTGWNAAQQLAGPEGHVLFPPIDIPWVCRRFLRRIKPSAVIVLETELWPNLFRECKRYGAALLVVNGRISDGTFPRYRATDFLWRRVLSFPDSVFAQSAADAERYLALGAPAARVRAAGNLKFSLRPAPAPIVGVLSAALRDGHADSVIVAGSTMDGEEVFLLDAFERLLPDFPRLWMILAPRHPQRFRAVKEQIEARGISLQMRSEWRTGSAPALPGILLLDSMGELGAIYELATVAFVGGTLVPTGGHNILEPAFFGKAIVTGASMANFREIADEFLKDAGTGPLPVAGKLRTGATIQIEDPGLLAPVLRFLLGDAAFRRRMGKAARERWRRNRSGAAAVIDEVLRLLAQRNLTSMPAVEAAHRTILDASVKAE